MSNETCRCELTGEDVSVLKMIAFAVAVVVILFSLTECNGSPARGQKVGQLVKVASQGFFVKTCEAELVKGGLTGGSGTVGAAPFDFTISDEALVNKAEQYMRNQTEVVISYKVAYFWWRFSSENHGTFLVDIQPMAINK